MATLRFCPTCRQVAIDEFPSATGTGITYTCTSCGEEYLTLQALANATRVAGRRRRVRQASIERERAETEAWTEERGRRAATEAERIRTRKQQRGYEQSVYRRTRRPPPPEHIPGLLTEARGMGIIAQGLGFFVVGLVAAALLGSWLLFLAFLCWSINSIIRMPADPIRQRIEAIRNRYNQLLQRAGSDNSRDILLRQMRADTAIESVMARITREADPTHMNEVNRQWQRSFKSLLNVAAFALLVIGVVYTGLPGAGLWGLIISFVAYFMLRGHE